MSRDRNLLFGMTAVQAGLVRRDQVLDAMAAWTARQEVPLATILREQGVLTEDQVRQVEARVGPSASRNRAARALAVCVLLLGAISATAVWALQQEKARTARALEEAQANLHLARQAVDDCFAVAKVDPIFQGPEMVNARRRLLEKTLPFYEQFVAREPAAQQPKDQ